jgi:hypothetical protein
MTAKLVPIEFFNMLPIPIIVSEIGVNNIPPAFIFINNKLVQELGWTLDEIPDRNAWSKKVYPDEDYLRVVEEQWDLNKTIAKETNQGFVNVEVNLATKFNTFKRFKIYTQITNLLIPGHYVLAFERLSDY